MHYLTLFIVSVLLAAPFSSIGQSNLYISYEDGDIYTVSGLGQGSCTVEFVGATSLEHLTDIALTPNGKLWGISSGNLYEIDTADAYPPHLVGFTWISAPASLVALDDTTLLTEFGSRLYAINTSDPMYELVGEVGYMSSGDLEWYNGELFMSSLSGLVKINLGYNPLSVISVEHIPWEGSNISGGCFGLLTVPGSPNKLFALSGTNISEVCTEDGSYQFSCWPGGGDVIYGGASKKLPVQPHLIPCSGSTSIQQDMDSPAIMEVYSNPFSVQITVSIAQSAASGTLELYSPSGQKLKTIALKNTPEVSISSTGLSDGIYLLRLVIEGRTVAVEKLMVLSN